jgi:regulator of protease activity HflC (stomatin/prohibitin superfamily)
MALQAQNLRCGPEASLRWNHYLNGGGVMHVFPVIIGVIAVWIGVLYLVSRYSVIVYEFERGLKYRKGKFVEVLKAGRYWIFFRSTTVKKIDVRPKFVSVPGQEVLSADSVTLKISVIARYEITGPDLAVNKIENYAEAFYAIVQLALRDIIGSMRIDEVLEQRATLNQKLMELTAGKAEELGLKVQLIGIKDIMFPGELKKNVRQGGRGPEGGLGGIGAGPRRERGLTEPG